MPQAPLDAAPWSLRSQACLVILLFLPMAAISYGMAPADDMPPETITNNNVSYLVHLIEEFISVKHRLPFRVAELHQREDRADCSEDGWGNKIQYSCEDRRTLTLTTAWATGPASTLKVRCSMVDPQDEVELNKMHVTLDRLQDLDHLIFKNVAKWHRIPATLPALPDPAQVPIEYDTRDGWGHEISYKPLERSGFELKSEFDADGKHFVFERTVKCAVGSN